MRFINRKTMAMTGAAAALVALACSGTAAASSLIDSNDIKDDTVRSVDIKNGTIDSSDIKDGSVRSADMSTWVRGKLMKAGTPGPQGPAGAKGAQGVAGAKGATGPQGPAGSKGDDGKAGQDGKNGMLGAYYATAFYDSGDTNAGAIATAACTAKTDVAISGGVQVLGLGDGAESRNTPVSSSFPGRMDWSTKTPKDGRLDGWIVQFGGNAGATSDKDPEKVQVWALCLPGAHIPVTQTYQQSAG